MGKRSEAVTEDSLSGLTRHHPYLLILQKEDWKGYLLLLSRIYDHLEENSTRVPMDAVKAIALRFYSLEDLASPEQKVAAFFAMAIGELGVLKDSHDQTGQRFLEPTRSGKALLHLIEGLIAQRNKFSGIGAETMLGALNDILISRRDISEEDAIKHHKEKIEAYRADMARIKSEGLAAAQLLPIPHSHEALFVQAEEASIHVLQSIEDVKSSIEVQRKELAEVYFQKQRSAGETLGAVADFYAALYRSPSYTSYIQAKELLSYLEGFQARFGLRNVDRLLLAIENRDLLKPDIIRKSNLRSFMHQFSLADASIQEKIKSQIYVLQQQVLYAIATDVEGLRASLFDLLSLMVSNQDSAEEFWRENPVAVDLREEFNFGPVELFDFELPVQVQAEALTEQEFDIEQQRELFFALLRAEEGTLKDILARLREYLSRQGQLKASGYGFAKGLAEYYVLSEAEIFDSTIRKTELGKADLNLSTRSGQFVLRQVPDFILQMSEVKP